MNNLKSISGLLLVVIVISISSCKKNKNNNGNSATQKYVPTQINIRDGVADTLKDMTKFSYNDKQQITRITTGINRVSIYNLFYLSNGNMDYFESQYSDGSNYTGNWNYDSGERLISISSNDTVEFTFAHTTASNIYTIMIPGSSGYMDIDLDENDNIESWSNGTDTYRISYLKDQNGVFANVKLNPSVILPFHILPRTDLYFMHFNQITQFSILGSGSDTYLYVDQERDANGNLTSFKVIDGTHEEDYIITYELK